MTKLTIDSMICNKCGACVEVCPYSILELNENEKTPVINQERLAYCIHCGHCEAVCPGGAVQLDYPEAGEVPDIKGNGKLPSPEEMSRQILMRRSVREYQDKPVPKGILEEIIKVVHYAPTGVNGQSVHWLGIYEKEKVRDLAEKTIEWMRFAVKTGMEHPLSFAFPSLVRSWDQGQDPICRNAPHLMIAYGKKDYPISFVDSIIALSYFDLLAPSYGIGTCWAGMVQIGLNESPELRESLGLPEGYKAQYSMLLGYPKYPYQRVPKRNQLVFNWKE